MKILVPLLLCLGCHNLIITPNVIQAPDTGQNDVFYHVVLDCEKPSADLDEQIVACLDRALNPSPPSTGRPCSDIAPTKSCLASLYPTYDLDGIGCKVIDIDMMFHASLTKGTASKQMGNDVGAADLWITCEELGTK